MGEIAKPILMVYTGDGKGKTSAAMGQMMRALGHGARCAVAQFIKQDPTTLDSGEYRTALKLGIVWKSFGSGFTWVGDNNITNAVLAKKGWEQVKRWISTSAFDLIVLDEFTYTLTLGYLDAKEICLWLADHKAQKGFPHLVITGRAAPQELLAIADMVSEIQVVKHHMLKEGTQAAPLIEF
ncbi:cob(I)yrinic acid a,c-diamide adenosyltransferase [Sphaerochaeta sp. PS]|uniref:cob(I)yrinic acid a,c-diamide adenosyltransferase n=1 Tax=Sphaerochaeta sp. PS TaxID=3076336 RepID=UPI0028A48D8A|nr:cob(I)yrinic acid a,c-diamide adenosyltransferase [Sphaerochaeta sp. PS]MDT4762381.1 cob(I)yrinic acid a,c-diamide adenosyltransferase [Sphaerochaeta sp. PS]